MTSIKWRLKMTKYKVAKHSRFFGFGSGQALASPFKGEELAQML